MGGVQERECVKLNCIKMGKNIRGCARTGNLVVDLSFEFALGVIEYCRRLEGDKKYVIANQLLRSGTSIGANIREAQNAESGRDFLHKMKLAAKELEETEFWFLLCEHSEGFPDCVHYYEPISALRRVINSIIGTTSKSLIRE